jgi:hypothetical protein
MRGENADSGVAVATIMVVAVLLGVGLLTAGDRGGSAAEQSPQTWAIGVRLVLAH